MKIFFTRISIVWMVIFPKEQSGHACLTSPLRSYDYEDPIYFSSWLVHSSTGTDQPLRRYFTMVFIIWSAPDTTQPCVKSLNSIPNLTFDVIQKWGSRIFSGYSANTRTDSHMCNLVKTKIILYEVSQFYFCPIWI